MHCATDSVSWSRGCRILSRLAPTPARQTESREHPAEQRERTPFRYRRGRIAPPYPGHVTHIRTSAKEIIGSERTADVQQLRHEVGVARLSRMSLI
jgi:hypothetical protein